jgi:hypothetical protein
VISVASKGLDRLGHVVEAHPIIEGGIERIDIGGHRRQRGDDVFGGVGHLDSGLDRAFCLFLEVGGTAVPELGDVEHGVEQGRRVARPRLPAMADRGGQVVVAAGAQVVDLGRHRRRQRLKVVAGLDVASRAAAIRFILPSFGRM